MVRWRWGGNILKGCESVAGRVAHRTLGEEQNQLAQAERVKGGRARCYLACSLDEISASSFRPFPDPPSSSQPPRHIANQPPQLYATIVPFESVDNVSILVAYSRQLVSS